MSTRANLRSLLGALLFVSSRRRISAHKTISHQAHQRHRAVRGRRQRRRAGPHRRRSRLEAAGATVHLREPHGCRRQHRRGRRRQGQSGRLHARCRHDRSPHDQSASLQGENAVRCDQGREALDDHGDTAEPDRGQQRAAGEDARRADRLHQGEPGQRELCELRRRNVAASVHGVARPGGRAQDGARALSGVQPDHAGSDGGPRQDHMRQLCPRPTSR